MDRTTVAIAMAMVVAASVASLPAIPTVAAVSADCNDEYTIQDSEPATPRRLLGNGEETGIEDVTASGGPENVTVRLDSDGDELLLGVFVPDPNTQDCVAASSLGFSDCGASETLDTTGAADTDTITCEIDPPTSGTRNYYFHAVNNQSNPLSYTPWMSD